MPGRFVAFAATLFVSAGLLCACSTNTINPPTVVSPLTATQRVLLLSIDGMHASDLSAWVGNNPNSTLAMLSQQGLTYGQAYTPAPSDSFPGLLALVTGGNPVSTGVYYDVSYDRGMYPPGSDCTASTTGTTVTYDESIDVSQAAPDLITGIDTSKLPKAKDSSGQCNVVYPHSFLLVNTVFEVVKANGGYTAWADKHPAYELVNGPSGTGVDDLFVPEINTTLTAAYTPGNRAGAATIPANTDLTAEFKATQAYDAYKLNAVLNQIDGLDSSGSASAKVPTVFGMNFQELSVAQKNDDNGQGGYSYDSTTGATTPNADVASALADIDGEIGQLVSELKARDLFDSTLIIVTAKHGQSPQGTAYLAKISSTGVPGAAPFTLAMSPGDALGALAAQATEDDVSLLWLADESKLGDALNTLNTATDIKQLGYSSTNQVRSVVNGLPAGFGVPSAADTRTPDIVVESDYGVIYSKSTTKLAEHGGFSGDDRNVALLVSITGLKQRLDSTDTVYTTQVAPTILSALAIDPSLLQAVKSEQTQVLPNLF